LKVTIVYDNEVYRKGLKGDWGFSCLIEADDSPRILFDTGADGAILLSNMEKLDLDPGSIDEVFISHAHRDHTGGLQDLLRVNESAQIYVPPSFVGPAGREVITVRKPTKIHENIFSTGELKNIEQSMAVRTDKGVVLIVGCSHPGMGSILDAASQFGRVYAVVGGFHGFREFHLFKELEVICPTHCTRYKSELQRLYSERVIEGGAGKVMQV